MLKVRIVEPEHSESDNEAQPKKRRRLPAAFLIIVFVKTTWGNVFVFRYCNLRTLP